ncbi:hypothetical protein AYO47_02575 [Planctomyces sp. SCGC AG-212-M04]|nr:hypothetical protein AYO47_02575 [Planctomyces sp. SCGC AG-212-M04]
MQTHRHSSDHLPAGMEPMREDDVRRMLAARAEEAPKPRQHSLRQTMLRMAILFTLYVLSIGPLYWRWYGAKSGLDSQFFLIFFRPLEVLAKWIPALGHFLNWYVSLWIY